MSRLRFISVWVVAISAILIVYRLYNRLSDTPVIEPPGAPSSGDLPEAVFGDNTPGIGTTQVGQAENAHYTFVDEQTKQVTRVFGFQKLLNPETGSRKWNLAKPYITMYEKAFDCEITADRGALTIEMVKGNPSPTEGQLYENVVIRIIAKSTDQPLDSVIYMDHLDYNSERSEFFTDGPVRVVSPRADMECTGMLLVYNPAMGRIEFLKVLDLAYLKLKDIGRFSSRSGKDVVSADSPAPADQPAADSTTQPPTLASTQPGPGDQVAAGSRDDLYSCTFSRDVVIRYGHEVTVQSAQEVFIDNILWPRGSRRNASAAPADTAQTGPQTAIAEVSPTEAPDRTETPPEEAAALAADQPPAAEPAPPVDVLVTCKGGFVAKPLTSVFEILEPTLPRQPAAAPSADTAVPTAGEADSAAYFKAARTIRYDMATGYGLAEGPVELTFSPAADPNADPNATVLPMVVTAEKNAEFFPNADKAVEKIVFNRNVVGTRKVLTPEYVETSSFHGEMLTTDLQTAGQRSGQIRHIAVTDGNVKLDSIRTKENGDLVSHVDLVCVRIDNDAEKEIVYATGPGTIRLNNANVPPPPAGRTRGKLSLAGPYYALVKGFSRLTWFVKAMQVNADGQENSVHVDYMPVENGQLGQVVRGSTAHLQANFWPLPEGGHELATIITAGGIYYAEDGGNVFTGEDLLFDAKDGLLVISSSERNACLLNGALVDRIEYEVNTGRVRSNLSSSPGAVTVPVKP